MRKTLLGVITAAALAVPLLTFSSAPDAHAAVPGTKCAKVAGKATFTPALPKVGSVKKVTSTIKANGSEKVCTGGGVASGALSATIKFKTPGNCQTLASGSGGAIHGTLTVKWNVGATSTIAVTLKQVTNKPTQATLTGPVTAGKFKGDKASQTINFVISSAGGDCVHGDLRYVTFTQQTPLVIK